MVMWVYDFTQNAVAIWRGSKMAMKQQILREISLNRTMGATSLCLEKI